MKDKEDVWVHGKPAFYAVLYNPMKEAALNHGYALAIHGSLHSDMDLIAVPWTEEASPVHELVKAINECLGKSMWTEHNLTTGEERFHGRICYALSIGGDWFIDFSIMKPKRGF